MADLCGQAFKAAWFVKATLRNGWWNSLMKNH
jgi:hypothetical protein